MGVGRCEDCVHLTVDMELDEEYCDVDLDEDEMMLFLTNRRNRCPYYKQGDEYTLVRKQN